MANEIQFNLSLSFSKSNARDSINSGTVNVNVSGTDYMRGTQNVGTSDETIALVDIGTPGYAVFHNLDATNYVDFGGDGTNYFVRCQAGEWAMLRVSTAAVHAKANTAACNIEYFLIEA